MPELPDIVTYLAALEPRVVGRPLEKVRLASPFLLRTFDPPIETVEGRTVRGLRRIGKRLVLAFDPAPTPLPSSTSESAPPVTPGQPRGSPGDDELFLVLHLMVAGRLRWRDRGTRIPAKVGLAAFEFPGGSLLLTEASTKKRASLHLVKGEAALAEFARGGIEPLEADLATFGEALRRESHTVKRALTDPTLFSGIGNAYSDEILHRAKLSPLKLTTKLDEAEVARLWQAARETLAEWIDRLRRETGDGFPEEVTASRKAMAVHGRYRRPCPVCGSPVQRIVYAENEANYCPTCQTEGKLLADRALSRLLGADWPRTLEELEERRGRASTRGASTPM